MWIARQGRRQTGAQPQAQVGRVTLPGDPAGVYLSGERRELPVFAPGGYVWRPAAGREVLVLKTGPDGAAACVAGERCGAEEGLEEGEVLLHAGKASIRLSPDGTIWLEGQLRLNGSPMSLAEG